MFDVLLLRNGSRPGHQRDIPTAAEPTLPATTSITQAFLVAAITSLLMLTRPSIGLALSIHEPDGESTFNALRRTTGLLRVLDASYCYPLVRDGPFLCVPPPIHTSFVICVQDADVRPDGTPLTCHLR